MSSTADYDINKQFQDMIKSINAMNDKLVEESVKAVVEGAEIIMAEQKRIISAENPTLASLIKRGQISISKNKKFSIVSTGYFSDAIQSNFEALLYEFGRPGKKRGGTDKLSREIGKWSKERVLTTPHIRKGFEIKKKDAFQCSKNALDTAIKEFSK